MRVCQSPSVHTLHLLGCVPPILAAIQNLFVLVRGGERFKNL